VARTPERARDLAASVQSAWQRSREAGPEDPGAQGLPAGADMAEELPVRKPAVERDPPQTPDSEEAR
jgi:hypothetical protein